MVDLAESAAETPMADQPEAGGGAASASEAAASPTQVAVTRAVRELRAAEPKMCVKLLVSEVQARLPELGAGSKEVRKAVTTLESEAAAGRGLQAEEGPLTLTLP